MSHKNAQTGMLRLNALNRQLNVPYLPRYRKLHFIDIFGIAKRCYTAAARLRGFVSHKASFSPVTAKSQFPYVQYTNFVHTRLTPQAHNKTHTHTHTYPAKSFSLTCCVYGNTLHCELTCFVGFGSEVWCWRADSV